MQLTKKIILAFLKLHKNELKEIYGVESLALFGSYSRDEATDKSDVDILFKLKKEQKLSIFKYLKLLTFLENKLQHKVDLVREEKIKPMLKEYISKDIIYV